MIWFFRRSKLATVIRRQGIELLIHSTHLYKNLPQILADNEVLTAGKLQELHGQAASRFLHDPNRYEKYRLGLDYINCSLTVPNSELLYHRSRSDWKVEWAHLALELSLLTREDTYFCPFNAAVEKGLHVKKGADGLLSLYADTVDGHKRTDISHSTPTHPQAEVLIKGPLPLSAVKAIIVSEAGTASEVERLCEEHGRSLKIQVMPQLFVWPKRLIK
jgi:hypothetical protein